MASPAPVPWVDPPVISAELEQAVRDKQTANNASAAKLRFGLALARTPAIAAAGADNSTVKVIVNIASDLVSEGLMSNVDEIADLEEVSELFQKDSRTAEKAAIRKFWNFVRPILLPHSVAAAAGSSLNPAALVSTDSMSVRINVIKAMTPRMLHFFAKNSKNQKSPTLATDLLNWTGDVSRLVRTIEGGPLGPELREFLDDDKAEPPTGAACINEDPSPAWTLGLTKIVSSLGSGFSHLGNRSDAKTGSLGLVELVQDVRKIVFGGEVGRLLLDLPEEKQAKQTWPHFMGQLSAGYKAPESPSAELFRQIFSDDRARNALQGHLAIWACFEKTKEAYAADREYRKQQQATAAGVPPVAPPPGVVPSSDGLAAFRSFRTYVESTPDGSAVEQTKGSVNMSRAQRAEIKNLIGTSVRQAIAKQTTAHANAAGAENEDQEEWEHHDDEEVAEWEDEDEATGAAAGAHEGDKKGGKKGGGKRGKKGGKKGNKNHFVYSGPQLVSIMKRPSPDSSQHDVVGDRDCDTHTPDLKKAKRADVTPPAEDDDVDVDVNNFDPTHYPGKTCSPNCTCDFLKNYKVLAEARGLKCKIVDPSAIFGEDTEIPVLAEDEAFCKAVFLDGAVDVQIDASLPPQEGAVHKSDATMRPGKHVHANKTMTSPGHDSLNKTISKKDNKFDKSCSHQFCTCGDEKKTLSSRRARKCTKCSRWISDSGASHHMLGKADKGLVEKIDYSRPVKLKTADRTSSTPGYMCTLVPALRNRGLLSAVYHPDITCPLLSTRQLLRDRIVREVSYQLHKLTFKLRDGRKIVEMMSEDDDLPFVSMPVHENDENKDSCQEVFCNRVEHVSAGDDDEDDMLCIPVEEATPIVPGSANATRISRALKHVRNMHIHDKKGRRGFQCMGCLMGRSSTHRGKPERPKMLWADRTNFRVGVDFVGPWPESYFDNTQLFVMVDEYDRWVEAFATPSRSCCGELLDKWVTELGRMDVVRSDNAPEFKADGAPLRIHAEKWKNANGQPIRIEQGAPYCPQANGITERANRTILEIVRSSLIGADPRCWDLCATAAAHVINRCLERKWNPPGTKEPKRLTTAFEVRRGYKPSTSYFRRWGCLAFIKDQHPDNKTSPRRIPAMFVGYTRNGAWKVLLWKEDGRCKTGYRLALEETKHAAFVESVLVRDVEKLCGLTENVGSLGLDSDVIRCTQELGCGVILGNQSFEFVDHPDLEFTSTNDSSGVDKTEHADPSVEDKIDVLTRNAIDQVRRIDEKQLIDSVVVSEGAAGPDSVSEGASKAVPPAAPDGLQHNQQEKDLTDDEIHDIVHRGDDDSGHVEVKSDGPLKVVVKKRGRPRKVPPTAEAETPQPEQASEEDQLPKPSGKKKKAPAPKPGAKGKGKRKGGKVAKTPPPPPASSKQSKKQKKDKKAKAKAVKAFLAMMGDGSSSGYGNDPSRIHLEDDEEIDSIDIRLVHRDALASAMSAQWIETCIPSVEAYYAQASANTITVPRREALHGPDSLKYRAAMAKERLALEAMRCWRDLTPEELKDRSVQTLPSAVVFTRKRPCAEYPEGKYKARLVVLGNLQNLDSLDDKSVYAPVSGLPAARAHIINAAAKGLVPTQLDISNAFIQSELRERVNIRLPEVWDDSKSNPTNGKVVRLIRALYGLRISPVTWYRCFRSFLVEELGWTESEKEPGTFSRKLDDGSTATLLIYVDDCLLFTRTAKQGDAEVSKILKRFNGQKVPPVATHGTCVELDFLGVQILYDPIARSVDMIGQKAIQRMMKKFNFQDNVRKCSQPSIREDLTPTEKERAALEKQNPKSAFPLRSLIGGLNWVAQTVRPDIAFAVNRVARFQTTPTTRVVDAAKRILRYLAHSQMDGLKYSPAREADFNRVFKQIASEGDRLSKFDNVVQFSDSDFAGCVTSLKSTSGSVHFLRGCPVLWQSRRQDLRAESTCESELYAAHDALKLTKGQGWVEFMMDSPSPILFVDNKSLIDLAKQEFTTKRSKHISLRYMSIRESVDRLCYCPTGLNLSDPLTKPMWAKQILYPELCDGWDERVATANAVSVSIFDFLV